MKYVSILLALAVLCLISAPQLVSLMQKVINRVLRMELDPSSETARMGLKRAIKMELPIETKTETVAVL